MQQDPKTVSSYAHRAGQVLFSTTKRRLASGAVAAVVVAGAVAGAVVASSGAPAKDAGNSTTTTAPAPPPTTAVSTRCPLTDLPAPSGKVPQRPALLVKIGNEPDGARPQSGLNEADIVFDTPAEGFIMRYVAVYQCNNASEIGPTRSVRWVDWAMIARQFVHPILAFAGGIDPNVNAVADNHWLTGANLLEGAQAAAHRISSRVPPDNLYTSTQALYSMFDKDTAPPPPVFDYSQSLPPGAKPTKSIGINFSYGTDVVWNWDPSTKLWLHTYSGTPDIDTLTNQPVTTTNIVVEIVPYAVGPYIESLGGTGDIESHLTGSGTGYVLRDGTSVKVTWHRKNQLAQTTFTNSKGQSVDLSPGRTWVEIVTNTQADAPGGITITP